MRTRILLPSALILFSEVFGLCDTDSFAGNERWLFFTNEFSYWRWELLWMQALTEMTWDELFPSGIFTSLPSMLLLSIWSPRVFWHVAKISYLRLWTWFESIMWSNGRGILYRRLRASSHPEGVTTTSSALLIPWRVLVLIFIPRFGL
jgi:hypothetical protein